MPSAGVAPDAERGSLVAYLEDCRTLALGEIRDILPQEPRCRRILYDLMLDYPLRHGKGLRPALCVATCRALGGLLEAVLRSAAVLELYHNAFLIHDDVEDGSARRRDSPTLHHNHGVPIAVNVGDAMLALSLQPLLDNMRLVGMGKAIRVLQTVARMARESAEGQAIELDWIRRGAWDLGDADYVRMVYKKTSWYTFVTPTLVGGIVAGATPAQLVALRKFASLLGVAFQIQDDVLNLEAEAGAYGKEIGGDLWEGKHTLILMHAMRSAREAERERARRILRKPRPGDEERVTRLRGRLETLERTIGRLRGRGALAADDAAAADRALSEMRREVDGAAKTEEEVAFLLHLVRRHGSVQYARQVARRWALAAERRLAACRPWLAPSVHRDFLEGLVGFVVNRDR